VCTSENVFSAEAVKALISSASAGDGERVIDEILLLLLLLLLLPLLLESFEDRVCACVILSDHDVTDATGDEEAERTVTVNCEEGEEDKEGGAEKG